MPVENLKPVVLFKMSGLIKLYYKKTNSYDLTISMTQPFTLQAMDEEVFPFPTKTIWEMNCPKLVLIWVFWAHLYDEFCCSATHRTRNSLRWDPGIGVFLWHIIYSIIHNALYITLRHFASVFQDTCNAIYWRHSLLNL